MTLKGKLKSFSISNKQFSLSLKNFSLFKAIFQNNFLVQENSSGKKEKSKLIKLVSELLSFWNVKTIVGWFAGR